MVKTISFRPVNSSGNELTPKSGTKNQFTIPGSQNKPIPDEKTKRNEDEGEEEKAFSPIGRGNSTSYGG